MRLSEQKPTSGLQAASELGKAQVLTVAHSHSEH